MKPVISKEKFPLVFFQKRDRFLNARRSLASNSSKNKLIPKDYYKKVNNFGTSNDDNNKIDDSSLQSLTFMNT